jgi:hypothetical protein
MIGCQLRSLSIFWSVKLVMLLLATVLSQLRTFPHRVRNRHHFKQIQQSEPT